MSLKKSAFQLTSVVALLLAAACSTPLSQDSAASAAATTDRAVTYSSNFSTMYVRGTLNSWGTTLPMTLVANNTWEVAANFGWTATESFKFDTGTWNSQQNWGDNNADKIADVGGANIPVAAGSRTIIRFNDATKAYSVTLAVDTDVYCVRDQASIVTDIDMAGLTVNLYETATNRLVRSSTVQWTTSHGIYAGFRAPGLLPGTYTAKIDEVRAPSTYYAYPTRFYGSVTWTLASTGTPSPNLNVFAQKWEAEFYAYGQAGTPGYSESELVGQNIELWDTAGNFLRAEPMASLSTYGAVADFNNKSVAPGSYVLKANFTKNGYKYSGTQNITVGTAGPNQSLIISREFVGGSGEIYYNLVGAQSTQGMVLTGLTAKLYKNGTLVNTQQVGSGEHGQPWGIWTGLTAGTYEVKLDEVKNSILYQGSITFSVSEAAPAASVTLWATGTPTYTKNYPTMYVRGAFNGWATTAMTLVANNTWRAYVTFAANAEFKFDALGNWAGTSNWGDNNKDGFGDLGGANIVGVANSTCEIRFNDATKAFTIVKQ